MVNTQSSIDDSNKKVKATALTAFGLALSASPAKLHIFSTSCSITITSSLGFEPTAFGPPACHVTLRVDGAGGFAIPCRHEGELRPARAGLLVRCALFPEEPELGLFGFPVVHW